MIDRWGAVLTAIVTILISGIMLYAAFNS